MRIFIAIELPPNTKEALARLQERLKTAGADVKWVRPHNIHLTLKFLGEANEKKLDKIMTLFLKNSKITNDEVEKFLHVSDATATRYLSQLEKEGKIKQSGKTGKGVSYLKI